MNRILCLVFLITILILNTNGAYAQRDNSELYCGRIGDYVFDDGHSNIIVANRDAGKNVAITFDDGPSKKYTEKILDILNKYNVKATFFTVGKNAEENPELLRRIHQEGHEIGNHTYSHPQMRDLSVEEINSEIVKTQEIIYDITGITPVLFRPPGGYLSNNIVESAVSNKCTPVLWSWRQDTLDWKCPAVDSVVSTVITNIRNGDIILFHDFNSGNSPTPCALEIIIPKLIDMGYKMVTVSELANM